jgi:putative transposase
MPDHAHWLIELSEHDALSDVVNRIKSASARRANRVLQRKGALWATAYHDHALRAEDDLPDTARYVVANPLRAGLVKISVSTRSGMRYGFEPIGFVGADSV